VHKKQQQAGYRSHSWVPKSTHGTAIPLSSVALQEPTLNEIERLFSRHTAHNIPDVAMEQVALRNDMPCVSHRRRRCRFYFGVLLRY
jgi:hypothetical protein